MNERLTLGLVFQKVVDLGSGTVVGADDKTVIVHVEDQVLALTMLWRQRLSGIVAK